MITRIKIIIILLISLEIILYEWGIFEINFLSNFSYFLKFIIPFILFLIAILYNNVTLSNYLTKYIYLFLFFSLVSFISCILSLQFNESIIQFIKIIPPRFLFIFSISIIFYKLPDTILYINRILFFLAIFTFVQYIFALFYIQNHYFEDTRMLSVERGIHYAGPLGMLGNINTQFSFFDFQFLRLTGFWNEPSNASAFLMSTFFLGLYCKINGRAFLNNSIIYFIPILGCLLCFSNAGYITLAISLSTYVVLKNENRTKGILKITPFILFIILGFIGREITYNFFPENDYLKLIVGIRSNEMPHDIDFSDGRIDNYKNNIFRFFNNPFGIGFRIPGSNANGKGDEMASASAFLYILNYTGIFGLIIVFMMKFKIVETVLFFNKQSKNKFKINIILIFSAWTSVTVQNLIYGNWMSFYYYYLSISCIVLYGNLKNKKYDFR